MQLGVIGMGRMGANIARRLMRGGHSCVVWDRDAKAVGEVAKDGATGGQATSPTWSPSWRRRARSG